MAIGTGEGTLGTVPPGCLPWGREPRTPHSLLRWGPQKPWLRPGSSRNGTGCSGGRGRRRGGRRACWSGPAHSQASGLRSHQVQVFSCWQQDGGGQSHRKGTQALRTASSGPGLRARTCRTHRARTHTAHCFRSILMAPTVSRDPRKPVNQGWIIGAWTGAECGTDGGGAGAARAPHKSGVSSSGQRYLWGAPVGRCAGSCCVLGGPECWGPLHRE